MLFFHPSRWYEVDIFPSLIVNVTIFKLFHKITLSFIRRRVYTETPSIHVFLSKKYISVPKIYLMTYLTDRIPIFFPTIKTVVYNQRGFCLFVSLLASTLQSPISQVDRFEICSVSIIIVILIFSSFDRC